MDFDYFFAITANVRRLYDGCDKVSVIFPINTNYPDTKQTLNLKINPTIV